MKSSHFSIGSRLRQCAAAILISLSAIGAGAAEAPAIMWLKAPMPNDNMLSHQSVAEVAKLKITDNLMKEKAEQLKKELKAKKVDLIELDNGQHYLLFTGPDKHILLYTTDGNQTCIVDASHAHDWYINSIDLVKPTDGEWYFIANYTEPEKVNVTNNCLFNADGKSICNRISGFYPVTIEGEPYVYSMVHSSSDNSTKYELVPVKNRVKGAYLMCSSKTGIGYVPAVTAPSYTSVALPNGGEPFRMIASPHESYFIGGFDAIKVSDYKNGVNMFNCIPLGNSGLVLQGSDPQKTTIKDEPVVIDGKMCPGRQITYSDGYSTRNNMKLKSLDGTTVIDDISEITFSEPDDVVYYIRKDTKGNGGYYTGALSLQDTTVSIPPLFGNALLCRDADGKYQRLVSKKPFENLQPYTDGMTNSSTFDNDGQLEFAKRSYGNCINYYTSYKIKPETLSAIDCRYALTAYQILGSSDLAGARKIQATYLNGEEPKGINRKYSDNWFIAQSLKQNSERASKIGKIADQYLAVAPESEKAQAKELVDAVNKISNEITTFNNVELPAAKQVYDDKQLKKQLMLEEIQRQLDLAEEREAAIRAERNAAIAQAFMTGLSNILGSSFGSRSSGGSYRGSSTSSRTSATASRSTGVSSGSTYEKPDNTNRIIFLKEQIADWKLKMKKAEASYQQALSTGDDTWQKKRVIDSKRNSVEECANMIRQYEAELNSLK